MSLKDTIVQWNQGVDKALDGKFKEALAIWTSMQEPGARIMYNIGSMHVLLGDLESAVKSLKEAVKKDPHLSLAYFQRGCVLLQLKRYSDSKADFESSMKTLRGNALIDYKQLGLQYKLYSCEVLYNYAYAHHMLGEAAAAKEKLETARTLATSTSESRHKIISAALDTIRLGTKFQSYQLPDKAMVFQPPRNKTEVLKPIDFLGKAKVVASVKDQDSYTGFVGVQEQRERQSPNPPRKPPSNNPPGVLKVSKPDMPAPSPKFKIQSRKSSLALTELGEFKRLKPQSGRPAKPTQSPPSLIGGHKNLSLSKSVDDDKNKKSTSPLKTSKMTVKVHYSTTRALRVSPTILYKQLQSLICKKFELPEDSLTLWCKKKSGGDLTEVADQQVLKDVCSSLDDGFRLTLWAYDKHETSPEAESEDEGDVPVLMVCDATHDYKGQYEDELSFSLGQTVEITADINDDWYEGRCEGQVGIFPKSYVKPKPV